jgi:capsular polysaccharide transport system permease protein
MYLLLPISGVFFMANWLPERYRALALYMPTVNAFEMIRGGQFGPSVHVYYDSVYTAWVCAALLALGLLLSRRIHRYLIAE